MRAISTCLSTFFLCIVSVNLSWGQTGNTVGLIRNDVESFNGYTIMCPMSSNYTYLIDNCGESVKRWNSINSNALAAHLTKEGNLLRSARISGTFSAGGTGGFVQLFNWDGEILWESQLAEDFNYHQHHDVKPMPNGNILILAWELNSKEQALELGRYPDQLVDDGMWTELIMEIEPIGFSDFNVVWEWHMNDHLIQDYNEMRENYGVISEHPELIDINYLGTGDVVDRFHANALDFNEELDQIVINCRNYNEFYVVDHSTTTEESAGHTGGNSGKGGDVLYRYGNPATYDRANEEDQKFYGQHGTNWINQGQYKNGLVVFNNGVGRPQGDFSSIEIVVPERIGNQYVIESDTPFGPESFDFAFVGTPTSSFYAPRLSNAVVLPNENILIADGQLGKLFEISPDKDIVWEYNNPVLGQSIVSQGEDSPNSNVFASDRYPVDYEGLIGELVPTGPIEINSFYNCVIVQEEVGLEYKVLDKVDLLENPVSDQITIRNDDAQNLVIRLFDLYGRQISNSYRSNNIVIRQGIDVEAGYYLLQVTNEANLATKTFKIIKG